jgi:hypothetical protein
MLKLKLAAAALLAVALIIPTGCSPQPSHPNQINAFDGASYDSLTLAHAALSSLRVTVTSSYPQYKSTFNQAAAAYTTAVTAYSSFRTAPADQSEAALAISALSVSIIRLESSFQADMHVQAKVAANIHARAAHFRASVASNVTISDVLTELEAAAAIAATVPGTQPYATIAEAVIQTTQFAVQALKGVTGQPIDLSTLTPIAPIA